ncbi:MAG: ribosome hibernation-promoting factor, HPF/YfiA family [Pseudomonadota bacterium]
MSGKHLDVGDSLRGHVTQAIAATVERYFGRAIEGKVTFAQERHFYRADISVHVARALAIQSHGSAADPYTAFDAALSRLDTRLQRYKGRLADRHKAKGAVEILEPAQYYVLSPEPEPGEDKEHGAPAIIAETPTEIATLTVGEAVMRLDLADQPALMFRNSAHGGLNTVYRRGDGTVGWIDPGIRTVSHPLANAAK